MGLIVGTYFLWMGLFICLAVGTYFLWMGLFIRLAIGAKLLRMGRTIGPLVGAPLFLVDRTIGLLVGTSLFLLGLFLFHEVSWVYCPSNLFLHSFILAHIALFVKVRIFTY